MEQKAKRGLMNLEFLCKRQLIDKVEEHEKLLSTQVTRLKKAKRNLQFQREEIKELNDELRRLKLENKHLQTILIRETDVEEQDMTEMLMNDFREERRNSMSLEHSLMVTKWELTEKIEVCI
ncbi:uncharacterized protein LOC116298476 [Actinia tenebrosa]|uniref:Uncharacterized protein LOC116298476 n=1 Tax=Actinia tenebrosa TaxID=6105 RepID=A0A6P8I4K7_ACTTE|nr:uncharacterized protein LOC116298476 [Actinia tenebrosa]